MADSITTFTNGWVQVRREAGSSVRRPVVRIRSSGDLAFSVDFVRKARIADCTRVNIYVSADGFRIGLRFHNDASVHDSFQLCKDGGSGRKDDRADSRVIQISALKSRSSTYYKLIGADQKDRTFEPSKDVHGVWVIELRPCFENRYRGMRCEIASDESGIYRYVLRKEVVYIGRGNLMSRFSESDRAEWDFDEIHYSVLNNSDSEAKWEAYWLERFREDYNRLPIYNRIAGRREPASKLGEAGYG